MTEKQGETPNLLAEQKALTLLKGVVDENSRFLKLGGNMLTVTRREGVRYLVELRTGKVYDEQGKFICLRVMRPDLPLIDQVIAKSIYLLTTPDPLARAYHDMLFKVALLGVKPAIEWPWIRSMAYLTLGQDFSSLIGVDFAVKEIRSNGIAVKLQMWYVNYAHRFRPIRTRHVHGSAGAVILCSDYLGPDDIQNLQTSIDELYSLNDRRMPIVSVALHDEREGLLKDSAALEIAERLATGNNIPFFACSLNHPATAEKPLAHLTGLILDRQSCA